MGELQNRHVTRILPPQFLSRLSTDFRSFNVNRRQMIQPLRKNCSSGVLMSKLNLFCQITCQISRFRSTHPSGRCAYDRNYSSRRDESLLYESLIPWDARDVSEASKHRFPVESERFWSIFKNDASCESCLPSFSGVCRPTFNLTTLLDVK